MKHSFVLISFLGVVAVCHADAVHLHINGPDGKPVVGAKVRVVEVNNSLGDDKIEAPIDLQSDATGVVEIESKSPMSKSLRSSTRTFVLARVLAPGLAVALADLKAGDNTLTLDKGQTLEGVVLDGDEKPLVGAKVALFQLTRVENSPASYLFGEQRVEAQSDAQGKWHLENVPLSGVLGFNVSAPHFKSESLLLDVSQATPPLFLERGGTIKGRLLKPDGTPAGGVKFYANDYLNPPQTKPDGTFEADASGTVYLQIVGEQSAGLPFIVPMKSVEDLEDGEVRDIGDWKGVEGVHLRGQVMDDTTKKPIAGASIAAWGTGPNSNGTSDAQGNFNLLISPDASSYSISALGYSQQMKHVTPPHDGVVDAGTLSLKSGRKVTGTLKSQDGHGIIATVLARKEDGNFIYASSDEDGAFELGGLEPGVYTISVSNYKLVGEPRLTVGAGALVPLQLVVNNGDDATGPRTVTGRVLFGDQPVAGAKVQVQFRSESGGTLSQTVVSNLNGTYTVTSPTSGQTPKIANVARPGYGVGYGELKVENGVWRGDVLLQKKGALLRGRVVDSAGKPVSHAFVGLDKSRELPVATDDKGEFALKDVPSSGITLLASDGPRLQTYKVEKAGGDLQIVLPDAPPVADRAALAEQLVPGARADWEWGKQWVLPDGESVAETLVQMRAAGGNLGTSTIVQTLATNQPEQFLAHAEEIRGRVGEKNQAEFERLLMLARASSQDAATRAQVKAWLDQQEQEKRTISPASVGLLLGFTEVAQKLDPKMGAQWMDYTAQIGDQLMGDGGDGEGLWKWGQTAARISPQAVETLGEEWKAGAKLQLLSSALQTYATRGDAVNARLTFAQMEKLSAQAEKSGETIKIYGEVRQPKDVLAQGRVRLVHALAPSDPAAALEAASPLEDYQRAQVLVVVARSAVKRGELDVARKALVAVSDSPTGNSEFSAQAAQIALEFDSALADQLFAKAFRKATPKNQNFDEWYPTISDYAQARASRWAGESRILLERDWAERADMAKKQKPGVYSNVGNTMKDLAVAMATVSPQRALEMADQVSTEDGLRASVRGGIALVLLKGQG